MNRFETLINGVCRLCVCHFFSGILPAYIVTEYPKSGGTWFGNMLSEYLGIPFPRNRLPKFHSCIIHGHYRYFPTMKNVFVMLRDGRDIMVSFYFHSFFKNELRNHVLVDRMRKELPFKEFNDVERNMPRFIEYKFSGKRPPRFAWNEFVSSWINRDVAFIKYEDLLADPITVLGLAVAEVTDEYVDYERIRMIVHRYSFSTLTKRVPGQEDHSSFMRKGIAGDWKNYFNKEAREIFKYYAGEQLIQLGYEKDGSWV